MSKVMESNFLLKGLVNLGSEYGKKLLDHTKNKKSTTEVFTNAFNCIKKAIKKQQKQQVITQKIKLLIQLQENGNIPNLLWVLVQLQKYQKIQNVMKNLQKYEKKDKYNQKKDKKLLVNLL